jgi:hypothetical protein
VLHRRVKKGFETLPGDNVVLRAIKNMRFSPLPADATVKDMLALFESLDGWLDMQQFADFFESFSKAVAALNPRSNIGKELKNLLEKDIEETKPEFLNILDFKKFTPLASSFDGGNEEAHRFLQDLVHELKKQKELLPIDEKPVVYARGEP